MGHWSTLYPSKEAAFNEVEVVSLKIGKASGAGWQLANFVCLHFLGAAAKQLASALILKMLKPSVLK